MDALYYILILLTPLYLFFFIFVWAYGAMETHQTSDLRIAGSIPAMLVFLLDFFPVSALNTYSFFISLNGNVAQSVERKSHNLKVVSSILTVPTFLTFLYIYRYILQHNTIHNIYNTKKI